jgi:hypothetical protein
MDRTTLIDMAQAWLRLAKRKNNWSARWRTKGKRNGMFKHGLYTKEAVQERRLLPELLRQSILADFVRSRSRRSLEHRIDDLMPD